MEAWLRAQLDVVLALQHADMLAGLMRACSYLGEEEFFLLLLPCVYLGVDARTGVRLAWVLLLNTTASSLCRLVVHTPRPYWLDPRIQSWATAADYGFPAGHVQSAAGIWWFLASVMARRWAWGVASLLVLLVAVARVFLGVHFPSDVIAGGLAGGGCLALFLWIEPTAQAGLARQPLGIQLLVSCGSAVLAVALGVGLRAVFLGGSGPVPWVQFAHKARNLNDLVASAGALAGVGVGWAMARRWAAYTAPRAWHTRLLGVAIGLAGVVACWYGLGRVGPQEPEVLGQTWRFVRYALVAWWLIFLAPWLLITVRLATPASALAQPPQSVR